MNLYIDGDVTSTPPAEKAITFKTKTAYPKCGKIRITLALAESETFELQLRIPEWSKQTALMINGQKENIHIGYTNMIRKWNDGDVIELSLDMRTRTMRPIPYGQELMMNKVVWGQNYMIPTLDKEDPIAHKHIALLRGPITLAQENRLGYSVDDPIEVDVDEDRYVNVEFPETEIAPYDNILEVQVPLTNGTKMTVTDYSSAGKLWTEESKMAAWMLTK